MQICSGFWGWRWSQDPVGFTPRVWEAPLALRRPSPDAEDGPHACPVLSREPSPRGPAPQCGPSLSGSGSGLAPRRGLSPAPAVRAQHRENVANDRVRIFERRPTGEDESVGVLVDDENLALYAATFDHRILAVPARRRPGCLQPLIVKTLAALVWFPLAHNAELVPLNRVRVQSLNAGRNTQKAPCPTFGQPPAPASPSSIRSPSSTVVAAARGLHRPSPTRSGPHLNRVRASWRPLLASAACPGGPVELLPAVFRGQRAVARSEPLTRELVAAIANHPDNAVGCRFSTQAPWTVPGIEALITASHLYNVRLSCNSP